MAGEETPAAGVPAVVSGGTESVPGAGLPQADSASVKTREGILRLRRQLPTTAVVRLGEVCR